jgi:hypothetical protein
MQRNLFYICGMLSDALYDEINLVIVDLKNSGCCVADQNNQIKPVDRAEAGANI